MKGRRLLTSFLAAVCAGAFVLPAAACGGGNMPPIGDDGMAELTYPDFEETPSDKNSWEYIPEDNDMTIEWYVDVSSWPIPAENDVLRKIKEETASPSILRRPCRMTDRNSPPLLRGTIFRISFRP